jgi:hypothetical protein
LLIAAIIIIIYLRHKNKKNPSAMSQQQEPVDSVVASERFRSEFFARVNRHSAANSSEQQDNNNNNINDSNNSNGNDGISERTSLLVSCEENEKAANANAANDSDDDDDDDPNGEDNRYRDIAMRHLDLSGEWRARACEDDEAFKNPLVAEYPVMLEQSGLTLSGGGKVPALAAHPGHEREKPFEVSNGFIDLARMIVAFDMKWPTGNVSKCELELDELVGSDISLTMSGVYRTVNSANCRTSFGTLSLYRAGDVIVH